MDKNKITNSTEPIRKLMFLKNGGVMDLDEWQNIDVVKTEDAEFEVVEPLMIDAVKVQGSDTTILNNEPKAD